MLLVVNQVDKTVSFVDPATEKQVAVVPQQETTVHAHEVEVTPDGKTAFLPVYGSVGVGKPGVDGQRMIVMDVPSRKITGSKCGLWASRTTAACRSGLRSGERRMLCVTTELDKAVTIVDPKTLKIVGKIPTSQEQSHMLAISHDGRLGYTANVGPGTVSVLDRMGRKTVAVIPISGMTQRISISNDDKMVFTSDQTKPAAGGARSGDERGEGVGAAAGDGIWHGSDEGWAFAAGRSPGEQPRGGGGPGYVEGGEDDSGSRDAAGGNCAAGWEGGLCLAVFG